MRRRDKTVRARALMRERSVQQARLNEADVCIGERWLRGAALIGSVLTV